MIQSNYRNRTNETNEKRQLLPDEGIAYHGALGIWRETRRLP